MRSSRRRAVRWLLGALAVLVLAAVAFPWLVRLYWWRASSNPVRRGAALAVELGCYHCHGDLGKGGIANPGHATPEVPGWVEGEWMDYVLDEHELRRYILDGGLDEEEPGAGEAPAGSIRMPAYRDFLDTQALDNLAAAFQAISGMVLPPPGTPAARGLALARKWSCFSCHGPAGSGGLPNPGSLTGFIPGWYGADFSDLVRDRKEFDLWIREGTIPRLWSHPVASFFLTQQRVAMPAYRDLTGDELDDLWAYCLWLARTDGGYRREAAP